MVSGQRDGQKGLKSVEVLGGGAVRALPWGCKDRNVSTPGHPMMLLWGYAEIFPYPEPGGGAAVLANSIRV